MLHLLNTWYVYIISHFVKFKKKDKNHFYLIIEFFNNKFIFIKYRLKLDRITLVNFIAVDNPVCVKYMCVIFSQ